MQVIKPEPEHVHEWISLVEKFLEEGMKEYNFGYRAEDCETSYFLWIRSQINFLLQHEGKIIGCIAGQITPHWFNYKTLIFTEAMFFILPEYRGRGALMLINAVEKECKRRGIKKMALGHTSSRPRIGELYKTLGFTLLESHYCKDVKE